MTRLWGIRHIRYLCLIAFAKWEDTVFGLTANPKSYESVWKGEA